MRAKLAAVIAGLGVVAVSAPVLAHHSFAVEYDPKKPVEGTGVISKVEWTNPHMRVYVDVTEPNGTVTTWNLELGAVNSVLRRGWKPADLKPVQKSVSRGTAAARSCRGLRRTPSRWRTAARSQAPPALRTHQRNSVDDREPRRHDEHETIPSCPSRRGCFSSLYAVASACCRHGWAAMKRPASAASTAFEKWKPWAYSQPNASSCSACTRVSTPSATTSMPRL